MFFKVWMIHLDSNPIVCEAVNAESFISRILMKSYEENKAKWYHASPGGVTGEQVHLAGVVKAWDIGCIDEYNGRADSCPSYTLVEAPFLFACNGVMERKYMQCTVFRYKRSDVTWHDAQGEIPPDKEILIKPSGKLLAEFSGKITGADTADACLSDPSVHTVDISASRINFYLVGHKQND